MKKFGFSKAITLYIVFGLFFCAVVCAPYFHAGYFPTHDGEWAVVRAGEMFREIRDHQFPARYSGVLNFGYGYPLFNFAYPFPYYAATLLHVFKIGFVDSIKIIFVSSVFISFFGMFALSTRFWKNSAAGIISAVLYVLLPYHLVDLYVRGSIGEAVSFALYPLLLLCCISILEKKNIALSVFSLAALSAALITTHNIAAVYFGIIFMSYLGALFIAREKRAALITLGGFAWGGVIASFFFIPALLEKGNIRLSKIPIADRSLYYVSVPKLLISSWGFGTPTDNNPFTYQLGIPQILGFLLGSIVSLRSKDPYRIISLGFILLSILFLLMMFPFMSVFWKLPLLSDINYPWTLLLPLGFLMCLLAGAGAKTKYGAVIAALLVVGTIVLYISYATPQQFVNRGDSYYLTNLATTTSSNELMPLWVAREPVSLFKDKVIAQGEVKNLFYSSNKVSFDTNLETSQQIVVNQIYYPGWSAYVDNKKQDISYKNPSGVMMVSVPEGAHNIVLTFSETKLRMVANTVSLLAAVALIGFGVSTIWNKRRSSRKKKR